MEIENEAIAVKIPIGGKDGLALDLKENHNRSSSICNWITDSLLEKVWFSKVLAGRRHYPKSRMSA
jgi:hypothetical protein